MTLKLVPLDTALEFQTVVADPPPPPPEDGSAAYILRLVGQGDLPYTDVVEAMASMRDLAKKGTRGIVLRKVDGKVLGFSAMALERVKSAHNKALILLHARTTA